jgi:subtilase-type serine protease
VLQPGLAPEEAAALFTDAPGNVLNVGGDVRIGPEGRLAVTIRSDSDYTSVEAAGDLVLDGELVLDVQGALTRGTVLTIMTGDSIRGRFDKVKVRVHERRGCEGWHTGGNLFRVSYRHNSVTLTVMHAVPPTAPPGHAKR